MPFNDRYLRQAALLIRVLPLVAKETDFALKGGTAINLFFRDMPRLSVDIDLTYVPIADRASSLSAIDAAMKRIAERTIKQIPSARVQFATSEGAVTKVTINADGSQTLVEVTPVLRGCVFDPAIRTVTSLVENVLGFAETSVVSFPDAYAGKIVAALDRQHPRDLFDVRDLMAAEGITDDLRRAFLIYLISHGRPMCEVLDPTFKDIETEFRTNFEGMTNKPVALHDLLAARNDLVTEVVKKMPVQHKDFLLSFEKGEPRWDTIGLPDAASLPAVEWRQINLDKISQEKRAKLVADLERVFQKT